MGNPRFAAPDEAAHYLRALGVAQGDWSGAPAGLPPAWALCALAGALLTANAARVTIRA
ncbi:MAG: hypothetical protein M3P50_13530 [Actinomycetota bacterium]|nr:hypothetical protein [Actinomycetota bacterium]